MIQRGNFHTGMQVLTGGIFSAMLIGLTFDGGLHAQGIQSIYLMLLITSIFLGGRALIQAAVLVITWGIAITIAELNGWEFMINSQQSPITDISVLVILVVLTVTFLRFSLMQLIESRKALLVARDEAKTASTAKSAFLANMSHELRTPLTAIIGYSELVMEELQSEDNDVELNLSDLERIRSTGRHLLYLVNDILDISKVEANEMKVDLAPTDIIQLIQEVNEMVQPLVEKQGNTLTITAPPIEHKILLDRDKTKQILLNLLSNAAKFTENGQITLTGSLESTSLRDYLVIQISDTGIGIPADKIESIFESFQQVENSLSRSFSGTGLGLALAKRFTEMMSGTIKVESELQKGSTFTVQLPIMDETTMPAGVNPLPLSLQADAK